MKIRLGTRGSALARAQTSEVQRRLEALGHECELVIIKTQGDKDQVRAFAEIGAPGLFVREIETALLEQRIDVAVHSYKDLPSLGPAELTVAAIPERVDPADRLIAHPSAIDPSADPLPLARGATVGTASGRRQALLRHLRPDLKILPLRGNVPTRLRRLREREYDAILLASAGLIRLGRNPDFAPAQALSREGLRETRLEPAVFVPAPAQGALALQARRNDTATLDLLAAVHDELAARPLQAERRLQELVEGGCQLPFGAWCHGDEELEMTAVIEDERGFRRRHDRAADPDELARHVWDALR